MQITRRHLVAGAAAAAVTVCDRTDAANPVASPWARASHSAVRLVAGGIRGEGADRVAVAGLEMELAKGFHTYWREPGDSGVPPAFDWSGSENLADIAVLWPAPRRFDDASGHFIGYDIAPLFPLHVRAKDAARPVALALKLDYAVCDKICIPASGEARLVLGDLAGSSRFAGAIAAAEARVPRRVALGETAAGCRIDGAAMERGDLPLLRVEGVAPAATGTIDIFVEGPPGSLFGKPQALARPYPGAFALAAPLVGRPKQAGRHRLTLTLCADDRAIEAEVDLDLPGKTL